MYNFILCFEINYQKIYAFNALILSIHHLKNILLTQIMKNSFKETEVAGETGDFIQIDYATKDKITTK